MTLTGRIRPKDLSLPPGWETDTSKKTGKTYYRNTNTGVTQWARPTPSEMEDSRELANRDEVCSSKGGEGYQGSEMSSGMSYISVASGNRLDCICDICDCGKHQCPVHSTMLPYGNIQSAYQNDYPWHDPQGPHPKPATAELHRGQFDPNHFATTNGTAYVAHDLPTRQRRRLSEPPPRTKFTALSTYQLEHGPKELPLNARYKVKHRLPPKIPFDHETTSKLVYSGEAGDRRTPIKPSTRVMPYTRFDGDSTYNQCYTAPRITTPTSRARQRQLTIMPEDRDFLSTKQIAYTKPPIQTCPAARLPKKLPSKHTGHTHYHKKLANMGGMPTYIYSP